MYPMPITTAVGSGGACYTTISLGAADTDSAPFYDYGGTDTLYVGDDIGKMHKVSRRV